MRKDELIPATKASKVQAEEYKDSDNDTYDRTLMK